VTSPDLLRKRIGARLRELRTGVGLTLDVLAPRLNMSIAKLSRIELGAQEASTPDLQAILSAFGKNLGDFFRALEPSEPSEARGGGRQQPRSRRSPR
jgi:transcriptional regulator with XRE-family HTH domain